MKRSLPAKPVLPLFDYNNLVLLSHFACGSYVGENDGLRTKAKKGNLLFFGEILNTEEKLRKAAKKLDLIIDEYKGVSFQETMIGFLQSNKLESSDIKALRLYFINDYFPARYPTSHKEAPEWKRHLIDTVLDARRYFSGTRADRVW